MKKQNIRYVANLSIYVKINKKMIVSWKILPSKYPSFCFQISIWLLFIKVENIC